MALDPRVSPSWEFAYTQPGKSGGYVSGEIEDFALKNGFSGGFMDLYRRPLTAFEEHQGWPEPFKYESAVSDQFITWLTSKGWTYTRNYSGDQQIETIYDKSGKVLLTHSENVGAGVMGTVVGIGIAVAFGYAAYQYFAGEAVTGANTLTEGGTMPDIFDFNFSDVASTATEAAGDTSMFPVDYSVLGPENPFTSGTIDYGSGSIFNTGDWSVDWSGAGSGMWEPSAINPPFTPSETGNIFSGGYHDPVYDPSGGQGSAVFDWNQNGPGVVNAGSAGSAAGTDWSKIFQTGQRMYQVWQATGRKNPAIARTQQLTGGGVSVPNKNGTITVTYPNGQKQTMQMPVGQPQIFPDGVMVMNNGDGTYSTLSANGQSVTTRYGSGGFSLGGFNVSPVMLGVGALALVLAMRQNRR